MNRQMVGRLATYHFTATERNKNNLLKENVKNSSIFVVGNTVIDALLDITSRRFEFNSELEKIFSNHNKTILLTTHRRENFEELENVYEDMNQLIYTYEDIQVVFPIHKSGGLYNQVSHLYKMIDKNKNVM